MQYLYFSEENLSTYHINQSLLSHSNISEHNRARLFGWLSEECFKQGISRYTFVLTCAYIDLFFMNKNDVLLKDYQLLALSALILASKVSEIEGKIPLLDFREFEASNILEMEKNIVVTLNYCLNPPIYIELLNNLAKMWDLKCQNGQICSKVRYFNQMDSSYIQLKTLYEKMDCLNLFKRILSFDIHEVVFTLFYLQTQMFHQEIELKDLSNHQATNKSSSFNFWQNSQDTLNKTSFHDMFKKFQNQSNIQTKPNPRIEKIIKLLTKQKLPVIALTSEEIMKRDLFQRMHMKRPVYEKTYYQMVGLQTHNPNGYQFYRKNQHIINKQNKI